MITKSVVDERTIEDKVNSNSHIHFCPDLSGEIHQANMSDH